ncbi:helix-turn-helix transcriptional regulator [Streptomyces durmitorensis]|uniref:Helix-turn-helix domain-containing protein n=1 Tax=Streptomyces durmitorensis TaxID=319947 RepID=A0ABY4PKK6_9ACTN|nr:helix-turn-helix domain-containing protein [Streptomyces durmitorensis]UQT54302.1 helix-turn-helix domain-containing protein [Streptomyces durmitorensis]
MSTPRLPVGARIRYHREQAGRSQVAIAGLCGITERYLSLIENGKKSPSPDLLGRLAAELGVTIAALLSDDPIPEAVPAITAAPSVAHALMGCSTPRSEPAATPGHLRDRIENAWRIWQTSQTRFTEAEELLPALIADVEHAGRVHRTGSDQQARREVSRCAADLYGLLRSYCRRTGRLDLSLMVADRAMRAAEDADDPIRIAAAQWNLGHVLLSHNDAGAVAHAREVAVLAVEDLQHAPAGQEKDAVAGALELVAVVAEARTRRWWDARARLEQRAVPLAKRSGEGNAHHTVFGPTNVRLHAVSIEMLAGEASEGLHVADKIDVSRMPSRERQFTFGLEVTRLYDLRREDAAVLVHLLGLEELAPEDLARSPLAVELVEGLLRRVRPTYRGQAVGLAQRLGLL